MRRLGGGSALAGRTNGAAMTIVDKVNLIVVGRDSPDIEIELGTTRVTQAEHRRPRHGAWDWQGRGFPCWAEAGRETLTGPLPPRATTAIAAEVWQQTSRDAKILARGRGSLDECEASRSPRVRGVSMEQAEKAMGLTISEAFLNLADEIVE
jgi:hypothetical protein